MSAAVTLKSRSVFIVLMRHLRSTSCSPGYATTSIARCKAESESILALAMRTVSRRHSAGSRLPLTRILLFSKADAVFLLPLSLLRWNGRVVGRRFLLRTGAACRGPGSWRRHT